MSKASETITVLFSVIAAVLLGNDSLRLSLGIAFLASCAGIWTKEICKAIRQRSNQ